MGQTVPVTSRWTEGEGRTLARGWTRKFIVIGSLALALAAVLAGLNWTVLDDAGNVPVNPNHANRGPQPASSPGEPGPTTPGPGADPPTFTVLVSGDVLLRDTLWTQAARDAEARGADGYDFRPMLAGVHRRISAADLAICHLETPVGDADGPYSDYPVFQVPPQIVPALAWAGYDACTTASNHTLDAGADGVERTLRAFDAAGIEHSGSARSAEEGSRMTILAVRLHQRGGGASDAAVRLALLSYTYGLNGFEAPSGKSWIVDTIDPEQILAEAEQARKAGADVVLVALHWGREYRNPPTADQQRIAKRLLASPDVDLVYGHHAHVPQPFAKINGKWVAYGLGNHLAEQATQPERTHQGVMARFTFTHRAGAWRVSAAEFIPTSIGLRPPFRLADLSMVLARDDLRGADGAAARRSYDQISEIVNSLGAAEHGLRPAR